jgi:hypothetical protein
MYAVSSCATGSTPTAKGLPSAKRRIATLALAAALGSAAAAVTGEMIAPIAMTALATVTGIATLWTP